MEAIHNRENNLNFVRFVAATIVVFGHGQAISGLLQTQIFGGSVAVIGVMTFFTISGYLITDSWERNPSLWVFFANRCLRIFPALVVVTILTAVILGPMVTSVSTRDYFSNPNFLYFFRNIWLYSTYFLPGLFEHNPIPFAVNGSLWSLAPEFLCYMIVAAIGLASARLRPYAFVTLLLLLVGLNFYYPSYKGTQIVYYATDVFQASAVMIFFMIGAVIRLFRIPLNFFVAVALLVVYFFVPKTISYHLTLSLNWIVLSYFVLSLGMLSTPILNNWGKPGDFSYGIYLYAFPIQQTIYWFTDGKISAHWLIVVSFLLSLLCAIGSWHLVESQFLKLKPKRRLSVQPMDDAATSIANQNVNRVAG
ncbi:acyltransferase family protein [Phyllobacterium bourgognense]|uniref:Peptidoglycan/LPS O-acetylase OafA/YrhL n=1 Tax=Phyllobacterium bourgognense TaxID=314236 RepID=A0A368YLG8_9HYPH|nr:acyltransferase [Phyllobacterium bourgognense]RCW80156.1 peptidoglycan/LPS O-acetylase OafA/YrhL [Phyllobacterium bourgognense]